MPSQVSQVTALLNEALAGQQQEQDDENTPAGAGEAQEASEQTDDSDQHALAGGEEDEIEEQEGEEDEGETLEEYAARNELDLDEIYSKLITADSGDGKERVSLQNAKDMWRRANLALKDFENVQTAFQQQQEYLDRERAALQQTQTLYMPPSQEELDAQFEYEQMRRLEENTDWWAQMEGQASVKEVADAKSRIRDSRMKLEEKLKGYNQAREQQREQTLGAINQRFESELVNRIPAWRDNRVAQAEFGDMIGMAKRFGISQNEVTNSRDPRTWHMLYELTRLAKLASKQPKPKKSAKRPLKGGSRASKSEVNKAQLDQAIAAATESSRMADKVSAVTALLRGS